MAKRSTSNSIGSSSTVPCAGDNASPPSTSAFITFQCPLCTVAFTTARSLTRHNMSQHDGVRFPCNICDRTFSQKSNLNRHMKTHALTTALDCADRTKSFLTNGTLNQQLTTHGQQTCGECLKVFQTRAALASHQKSHKTVLLAAPGRSPPATDPRNPPSAFCPPKGCVTALNGSYERYSVDGSEDDIDLLAFLRAQPHADQIRNSLARKTGVKFFVTANVKLVRPKNWLSRGDSESFPYFTSRCMRVLEATNIEELLEKAYVKIAEDLGKYLREGSGWVIDHIEFVELVVSTYKPLWGSSYIRLPNRIYYSQSVINVRNEDDKCFLWAVLSALHPVSKNPHKLCNYRKYENSLKIADLSFPMSPDNIPTFERMNGLTVNLFGFREDEVFPIYISDGTTPPINLLLISENMNQHYCWIMDFNKLMSFDTKHNERSYFRE